MMWHAAKLVTFVLGVEVLESGMVSERFFFFFWNRESPMIRLVSFFKVG